MQVLSTVGKKNPYLPRYFIKSQKDVQVAIRQGTVSSLKLCKKEKKIVHTLD